MGYSPMSPGEVSSSSNVKRIPTQEEVSLSGGVWAPTSAKRDKLGELKTALEDKHESLDDVATVRINTFDDLFGTRNLTA